MFNSKSKSSSQSSTTPVHTGGSNGVVSGTIIVGDIKSNSDIRIDGTLEGNLECQGRVIIGPSGRIDGKVDCTNAVIEGKFFGDLKVEEVLNIKDSAEIHGSIMTDKLVVQEGAMFNVTCSMGGQVIKPFGQEATKNEKPHS